MEYSKEELFEGFKLIYEFHNADEDPLPCWIRPEHNPNCYINDWSSLMEVVEKIESIDMSKCGYTWEFDGETYYNNLGFSVDIEGDHCIISHMFELDPDKVLFYMKGGSKIDATYSAILEFIKWWNENKPIDMNL